ncbi:lactate racemase domain-containing protein [Nocardioides acrostichi]|uniref:lactate racemase domain-containing protein n=1 Tax=Nocardioides acrostichi TaxID=2784339 RepID=UPI002E294601|nr:lactate racemase domain-containing protein [Nocardioides acrostichi]
MTRPGFVLEVDDRTPPLVVHEGLGFRLEEFPLGTRVVYPPESLPAVDDVEGTIRNALLDPVDSDPLPELLFAGMKLTIAFDDLSLPLPTMKAPDVRQRVIEQVLTMAAEAGVDDVEIIAANALHRRMTPAELRHIVGERVFRSFHPQGKLYNFDAEDRANLTHLGTTDEGEDVEISKRAAESDLLVYVNLNLVAMDGGHKSVGIGLASYKSLRHHHNAHTMVHSRSFMDHKKSAMHQSAWRMGRIIKEHVKVFQIETTVNNDVFPKPYEFLQKREWEWSVRDQASMLAARRGLALAPQKLRHKIFHDMRAPYGLTGVSAGEVEGVHEQTLERVHRQHCVEVDGYSDVLVMGVPYLGPYNVNSSMNPILATCMGLGYYFNSYRNHPVVRRGGAVILYHPLDEGFNQLHHPSYVDFYEEVLAETTDPAVIGEKYERQFAEDPWYVHLYRTSHAYHGVHPFYMWYWAAHAMDHVGDVVWVGGDRRVASRLGFRAASTLADALEMVSGSVGTSPSITYLHNPPHLLADVRV